MWRLTQDYFSTVILMPSSGVKMIFALVFLGLAAQATTIAGGYSIVDVRDAISSTEVIGPLKAGWACLPKGRLRWASIAKPSEMALARLIQERLSMNGANAVPSAGADLSGGEKIRLSLTILHAKLHLCVSGLGIGEKKPSGGGAIAVRIDIYKADASVPAASNEIEVELDLRGRDPRIDPSVLADAIASAADRFIKTPLPQ